MSASTTLTSAQRLVLERMRRGHALFWFGGNGPEMNGFPFWPQKATVRALLRRGLLRWGKSLNQSQADVGICPLELVPVA
jgi:hypothetical protein